MIKKEPQIQRGLPQIHLYGGSKQGWQKAQVGLLLQHFEVGQCDRRAMGLVRQGLLDALEELVCHSLGIR